CRWRSGPYVAHSLSPRRGPAVPALSGLAAMGTSPTADDLFHQRRTRLLTLLSQLSYEQREVTLASGMKSNFYIDCKQAVLTAEGHFLVGALLNHLLAEQAREVEAIGGLTMGADPLASAVATVSY